MDRINFNQTGGFPLDTDILDAMQDASSSLNALGYLAGDLAIISGCEETGSTVADGVVFIAGEVLPFKGGSKGSSVIITEEHESRIFEDGNTKTVITRRVATFGTSSESYNWADFKRAFQTTKLEAKHNDIEARLQRLENSLPKGLIAIWGKPANVPIPAGWQEVTNLRGKFPLGWNPNDADFATINAEGGEKRHTLTINEIPSHSHQAFTEGSAADNGEYSGTGIGVSDSEKYQNNNIVKIGSTGGGQSHNNMPPYRIIRYIEFVGF